jgi:hypothetical protein
MLPPRKAMPSDLSVQVAELGATGKAAPAFDYVGSIKKHPQLSALEKQSLLWVLAQSPCFHRLIQPADIGGHAMPDWVKCTGSGMLGIQISRQDPVAPERVYKMRGIAEIPASTEVGSTRMQRSCWAAWGATATLPCSAGCCGSCMQL